MNKKELSIIKALGIPLEMIKGKTDFSSSSLRLKLEKDKIKMARKFILPILNSIVKKIAKKHGFKPVPKITFKQT